MTEPITQFRGELHRFLSNFVPAEVVLDGVTYPTVEHAYQASKWPAGSMQREVIHDADTPGKAKRLGQKGMVNTAWFDRRVDIMRDLLAQKFQDPTYRAQLLATGDALLIERNDWGDYFWGQARRGDPAAPGGSFWSGENMLGQLLMALRDQLSASASGTASGA
jgi:ribA/ribD-fused uncharacterized protein